VRQCITRRGVLLLGLQARDVPRFRSDAALVRVGARVLMDGRIVPGLGRDDFVVHENGAARPVAHVATDQEPMDLMILLDISGSMGPHLRRLAEGAQQALQQLSPGDRAGIAAFHEWVEWVLPFTADLRMVEQRLTVYAKKMWAGGRTFTADALDVAAKYVRRKGNPRSRRAILVISDNMGSGSGLFDYRKTLTRLLEHQIGVSALLVTSAAGRVDLREVAGQTGGFALAVDDAAPGFAEVLALIRRSYAIYFRPAAGRAGEKRRAVVELSPAAAARYPRARILASREYVLTRDVVE
jgi:VWFA-related protein